MSVLVQAHSISQVGCLPLLINADTINQCGIESASGQIPVPAHPRCYSTELSWNYIKERRP